MTTFTIFLLAAFPVLFICAVLVIASAADIVEVWKYGGERGEYGVAALIMAAAVYTAVLLITMLQYTA